MKNIIKKILKIFKIDSLTLSFYNFIKKKLVHIYYFFSQNSIILLYHRVANVDDDPHLLSVEPNNFRAQLQYLKSKFNIISLEDLFYKKQNKQLSKKDIAITFDDGYADNLYNALPILKELKIPATIFITIGKIGDLKPFYWDQNTRTEDQGRALTKDELIHLTKSPLIGIGAHTLTHPCLSKLKIDLQKREIFKSKQKLESILDKKIISFSYPFGNKGSFNKGIINLVKQADFKYACVNTQNRVTKNQNEYTLSRYLVRNWNLKEFKKYFSQF